ncbi:hypothetical protein Trydic_g2677 [Trypoxylus dichotomus]
MGYSAIIEYVYYLAISGIRSDQNCRFAVVSFPGLFYVLQADGLQAQDTSFPLAATNSLRSWVALRVRFLHARYRSSLGVDDGDQSYPSLS